MTQPYRVGFERSGGFGGFTVSATLTSDDPDAEALSAFIRERAGREPGPPRGADRFQYDLTLSDDAGTEPIHVTVQEHEIPAELAPAFGRLAERAAPSPRHRGVT